MRRSRPIVVTGAAGLVGQNLIPRLIERGMGPVVAIDKHRTNTSILRRLNPQATILEADFVKPGEWKSTFENARAVVINHAQISALSEQPFIDNNVIATKNILNAAKEFRVPYVVHISSSVVNSAARDYYTETKKAQEKLVLESGLPCCILRPTLMFGWFDRKHLGWLARYMNRWPIFPIPGNGRYIRQPLYVGDFCSIVLSCIAHERSGEEYNISGLERIDYIDLIRKIKAATNSRATIVRLPYGVFWSLLKLYAILDQNPPFTTKQLKALVTPDIFEVIDWPSIFDVQPTPLDNALNESFRHPVYSNIVLEF